MTFFAAELDSYMNVDGSWTSVAVESLGVETGLAGLDLGFCPELAPGTGSMIVGDTSVKGGLGLTKRYGWARCQQT